MIRIVGIHDAQFSLFPQAVKLQLYGLMFCKAWQITVLFLPSLALNLRLIFI